MPAWAILSPAGVDPDHGVARSEQQPVEDRGGNAGRVVGRMVGLQSGREPAGQADGSAESRDHPDLARDGDQILVAHQFRRGGDHLRRQAGCQRRDRRAVGLVQQQPFAKRPHRQVRDRREGGGIVAIDDQPGDLVLLIRDHRFVEEGAKRQVGEHVTRRNALLRARRGKAGEHVARTERTRRGQHVAQALETVARSGAVDAIVGQGRLPVGDAQDWPIARPGAIALPRAYHMTDR